MDLATKDDQQVSSKSNQLQNYFCQGYVSFHVFLLLRFTTSFKWTSEELDDFSLSLIPCPIN